MYRRLVFSICFLFSIPYYPLFAAVDGFGTLPGSVVRLPLRIGPILCMTTFFVPLFLSCVWGSGGRGDGLLEFEREFLGQGNTEFCCMYGRVFGVGWNALTARLRGIFAFSFPVEVSQWNAQESGVR